MRLLLTLVLTSAFAAPTCTLDDCELASGLHTLSASEVSIPTNRAWMLHDLADARDTLRARNAAGAGRLAADLHRAVVAQADLAHTAAESRFLMAMHRDLAEVMVDAGWAPPATPVLPYMDQALSLR